MGKYNEQYLTADELREVALVIDTLTDLNLESINADHVQLGDVNGEIIGKVQYANNQWRFHPRKHDKPAVLGE